jgi:hypothetical protein
MNWDELKEHAKELFKEDCYSPSPETIFIEVNGVEIYFKKYGDVRIEFSIGQANTGTIDICYNRTCEQMDSIITALKA